MPSYSERYKFSEVEKDGQDMIQSMLTLCKVREVSSVNIENVLKIGVKDVLAKQLVSVLELVERQHMLIANQRGQIATHLAELNSTKVEG